MDRQSEGRRTVNAHAMTPPIPSPPTAANTYRLPQLAMLGGYGLFAWLLSLATNTLTLTNSPIIGGTLAALGAVVLVSVFFDESPTATTPGTGLQSVVPSPLPLGAGLFSLGVSLVLAWAPGVFQLPAMAGAHAMLLFVLQPDTRPFGTRQWFIAHPTSTQNTRGVDSPSASVWPVFAFVVLPVWGLQLWLTHRFGSPAEFLDDFILPPDPETVIPGVTSPLGSFSFVKAFIFVTHFALLWLAPLVILKDPTARRRFAIGLLGDALLITSLVLLSRRFTWPMPFQDPSDGKIAFHTAWALRGALAFTHRWPKFGVAWVGWAFFVMITCLLLKVTGMKDTVIGLAAFAAVEGLLRLDAGASPRWSVSIAERFGYVFIVGAALQMVLS